MQRHIYIKASHFVEAKQRNYPIYNNISIMRIALLFGSLAMAMGLILLPIIAQRNDLSTLPNIFNSQNFLKKEGDRATLANDFSQSIIPQISTSANFR